MSIPAGNTGKKGHHKRLRDAGCDDKPLLNTFTRQSRTNFPPPPTPVQGSLSSHPDIRQEDPSLMQHNAALFEQPPAQTFPSTSSSRGPEGHALLPMSFHDSGPPAFRHQHVPLYPTVITSSSNNTSNVEMTNYNGLLHPPRTQIPQALPPWHQPVAMVAPEFYPADQIHHPPGGAVNASQVPKERLRGFSDPSNVCSVDLCGPAYHPQLHASPSSSDYAHQGVDMNKNDAFAPEGDEDDPSGFHAFLTGHSSPENGCQVYQVPTPQAYQREHQPNPGYPSSTSAAWSASQDIVLSNHPNGFYRQDYLGETHRK